jgi:hypothetical protein
MLLPDDAGMHLPCVNQCGIIHQLVWLVPHHSLTCRAQEWSGWADTVGKAGQALVRNHDTTSTRSGLDSFSCQLYVSQLW